MEGRCICITLFPFTAALLPGVAEERRSFFGCKNDTSDTLRSVS